jgi:hypothetical protein
MRRLWLIPAAAALLAAPAPAVAAKVDVMVVGPDKVLKAPTHVRLKPRTVKVGHRRCHIGAATPLAALAGTHLKFALRDYGRCGRRTQDASGLYVKSVAGGRASGSTGGVYKVGRRAGTTGAADLSGPFGTGRRLRNGQKITWFWCELKTSGSCQRTLEVQPDRTTAAPGGTLTVTVRGYDDFGKGVPAAGATVRLGAASAVTGADGTATLAVPATTGDLALEAERDGMVQAFPREVTVG